MKTKQLIKILQETKHENVVIDIISETGHIFNNTFKIGQDDEKFNLEVNINNNEAKQELIQEKTYTRLFYVVDTKDENREIFETKEHAERYADTINDNYTILISEVNNWYIDGDLYNYDDYSDTFNDIITITHNYNNPIN